MIKYPEGESEAWIEKLEEKTLSHHILRYKDTPCWVFDRIRDHIETHKYLLEVKRTHDPFNFGSEPVRLETAFNDWNEYVFEPIVNAVIEYGLAELSGQPILVEFIHTSDRWMYMKQAIPYQVQMVTAYHAAASLRLEKLPFNKKFERWKLERFLKRAH